MASNAPMCKTCSKRHFNFISCEKHVQSLPRQPQWTPRLKEGERLWGDRLVTAERRGNTVVTREFR